MAVDAAVMVVDTAKGIEAQTKKLFQVCRMRGIPIFTFMNKLDRDGRDPLDLLEELEEVLEIDSYPMNWPIGMGKGLEGIYDIYHKRIEFYHPEKYDNERFAMLNEEGELPSEHKLAQDSIYRQVLEEVELLVEAGNEFDADLVAAGELTPVFFGSALRILVYKHS